MAKPKLALIPAAQGDKFYSVLPSDGVGDFDFTRNSSATRIAPTGFIQEVGAFGSDVLNGYNFTNGYSAYPSGSIDSATSFTSLSGGGGVRPNSNVLSSGKTYTCSLAGTVSTGNISLLQYDGAGAYSTPFSGTFDETFQFTQTGSHNNFWLRNDSAATTTITKFTIKEVIGNKSRLNYDLLNGKVVNCPHYLLEPARTNSVLYSEDFSNSYWTKSNTTLSSNQIISPDGSLNADKITEQNFSGVHYVGAGLSGGAGEYTWSCFLKQGTARYGGIRAVVNGFGNRFFVNVDLSNGNVVDTNTVGSGVTWEYNVEKYPNSWYRLIIQAPNSSGNMDMSISSANLAQPSYSLGLPAYLGNTNNNFYVWGAQFEQSSYPTSYIPTNGTAITRAAESAIGSGDAATFNDSEGVLMAEISALSDDVENKFMSISNGSNAEVLRIAYINGTDIRFETAMTSGTNFQKDVEINLSDNNKVCFQYKSNEYKVFINGFSYSVTQRLTTPIGLNELSFDRGDGLRSFYGNTREVQYFDSALTDAQLETLTSWTSLQEMITSQLYTNY